MLFLASTFSFAQSFDEGSKDDLSENFFSNFKMQAWSSTNGLMANTANALIQDKAGYIYIGTYDGLVRFDGVQFVLYNRNIDKRYSFLSVRSLMQDKDGCIWVGSNDEGVCCIHKDLTTVSYTTENGLPSNSVRALAQDKSGLVWIGTTAGVVYIDKDEKLQKPLGLEDYNAQKMLVTKIFCDTRGNTFIMGDTPNSLFIYSDKTERMMRRNEETDWTGSATTTAKIAADRIRIKSSTEKSFSPYNVLKTYPNAVITCMAQDNFGRYLFGVAPHYLVAFNDNAGLPNAREKVYDVGFGVQKATSVSSIMTDNTGSIWVGTDRGVAVIREVAKKEKVDARFPDTLKTSLKSTDTVVEFFNSSMGLIDEDINNIVQDNEDNIWLATDANGIAKLSLSKFRSLPLESTVNAIAQDNAREVTWLASDDGVHCIDKNLTEVQTAITDYCKNVRSRDVTLTENGDLLINTYEKLGFLRFSGSLTDKSMAGGLPPSITLKKWNTSDGLAGKKTRCALEARNGDLYCGTTLGLTIIKKSDGSIVNVTRKDGLSTDYIMCLHEDAEGTIWVGTDGGGVFTYDGEEYKIKKFYIADKADDSSLIGNVVFKITELQKGELWICTGSGISRFKDGVFHSITMGNGLGVSSIFQVLVDYTNRVWMTSNLGISSIKLQELEDFFDEKVSKVASQFYSESDGLHTRGTTSTSKSSKDKFGRIWFTLLDGVALYDPTKAVSNKVAPKALVQNIIIDDSERDYDGREVILAPGNKRFEIKYTGLSFLSSEHLAFRYMLKGFDKRETDWTASRTVSYTNLRPGYYTFQVKTKTANDVESDYCAPLVVIKKPFFYQVFGFWLITLINMLTVTAIIIIMRFKSMIIYQKRLENEVNKKTHELMRKNIDLENEKQKSESLLLNILPEPIAKELTAKPDQVIADNYDNVTVLFADIVGFTKLSSGLEASEVVTMLNALFTRFDLRAKNSGIEKIKTIGDCYMAACGLEYGADPKVCCSRMIEFARGMIEDINDYNTCAVGTPPVRVQMRIGINIGTLIAGVIGKTKFIYDIWGDTVNVASRMESTSEPLQIHVSESVYRAAKDAYHFDGPFEFAVKGKGNMETYFVDN